MDLAVQLDKGEDGMHDLENKDKKIQPKYQSQILFTQVLQNFKGQMTHM